MPLYSYICKQCEHGFDVQQPLADAALTKCPECGGELRKVFGKVGVTFKGSGFYRNDSGSSSKKTD
jgi:putative FmdB family regulatory protein